MGADEPMPDTKSPDGRSPEQVASDAADRLASALEEVGFDVGREFTMLQGQVGMGGEPLVELGCISTAAALRLIRVLAESARRGVTLDASDGD
jgi:hypothetical protein